MAAARTGRACGWLSSMVALPPIAAANGPTSMACATTWSAANPDRKALLCCRAVGWSNAALAGLRIGAACCATAPDGWMSQPGVSPSSQFCLVFRHCSIQCQSAPLDYENPTQTGSEAHQAAPAPGVCGEISIADHRSSEAHRVRPTGLLRRLRAAQTLRALVGFRGGGSGWGSAEARSLI